MDFMIHQMKQKVIFFSGFILLLQACSVISITQSGLKEVTQKSLQVSPVCRVSSTGVVYMNFAGMIKTDFIPASVKIEYGNILIYFDPLVIGDTTAADYIFITHEHADHFSIPDIRKLSGDKTLIVGPEHITRKLNDYHTKTVGLNDSLDFGDIQCRTVPSYNLKKGGLSMPLHKRSDNYLGYIISCDTLRIYVAGDTDYIPEMKSFDGITLAIVPIGEGKTAMNPEEAAEAVNIMQPDIVIPVHYEPGKDSEQVFEDLVNENIRVEHLVTCHTD